MNELELFTGMKLIKIKILCKDFYDKSNKDISGYTTTTQMKYKVNNGALQTVTATIENTYYLTYTFSELTTAGVYEMQGVIENSSGVLLKTKIITFSVKESLA